MTDQLIREVDEDVRAERYHQLWLRYRTALMLAVIAVVLATIAQTAWEHHREQRGGQLLEQFTLGQHQLETGKFTDAQNTFATLADGTSGQLNDLAELWEGRALAADQKPEQAKPVFKALAAKNDGLWSDLACLRLAALDTKEASCLTNKAHSPLDWQRAEWAAANDWQAGNADAATETLQKLILRDDVPAPAKAAMQQWLATIHAQKAAK